MFGSQLLTVSVNTLAPFDESSHLTDPFLLVIDSAITA